MTAKIEGTLQARGEKYGPFEGHAAVTQGLKRVMRSGRSWPGLPDSMKEALEMVAHKVGRIVNGDPYHHDSWHDIEGYVRLVSQGLEPKEKTT